VNLVKMFEIALSLFEEICSGDVPMASNLTFDGSNKKPASMVLDLVVKILIKCPDFLF